MKNEKTEYTFYGENPFFTNNRGLSRIPPQLFLVDAFSLPKPFDKMNIFMNIVDEVYLQIASFLLQKIKEEKFTLVFYDSSSSEQEERENVRV